jgi:hypothetical protein
VSKAQQPQRQQAQQPRRVPAVTWGALQSAALRAPVLPLPPLCSAVLYPEHPQYVSVDL